MRNAAIIAYAALRARLSFYIFYLFYTIQSFEKLGKKKDCIDITLRNLLESGSVLFSRAVSSQVLSALRGLTSVFGMGTGGSLSPLPPEILFSFLSSSFPENCTDPFPLRFPRLRFRLTYGFRFLTFRFFHTLLRLLLFPENSP